MKKSDIQLHSDGCGRPGRPAINVKVRGSGLDVQARGWKNFREQNPDAPERFNQAWLESNVADETQEFFWSDTCTQGFELAEEVAKELFGGHVKVYSEGRSGGWLIVDGLPDVEHWNGSMVAKWGRFVRLCGEYVAQVPGSYLDMVYHNAFLPEQAEQDTTEQDRQVV